MKRYEPLYEQLEFRCPIEISEDPSSPIIHKNEMVKIGAQYINPEEGFMLRIDSLENPRVSVTLEYDTKVEAREDEWPI